MSSTTGVSVSLEQNTRLFSSGTELESVVEYYPLRQHLCREGSRGVEGGAGWEGERMLNSSMHTVQQRKEV